MREEKRRRLEMKGWKGGTAQDVLGLMAEEAAYVELKVRLAMGMREWRRGRTLTQAELAKRLIRSLLTLGASRRELSRIMTARSPVPAA